MNSYILKTRLSLFLSCIFFIGLGITSTSVNAEDSPSIIPDERSEEDRQIIFDEMQKFADQCGQKTELKIDEIARDVIVNVLFSTTKERNGSGVIIAKEEGDSSLTTYYAITNYHVVQDIAREIKPSEDFLVYTFDDDKPTSIPEILPIQILEGYRQEDL
ncbi:MAG: hypothetical protein F6J86_39445, partial [Symploca sp. SIO1B1]|nr:hypothetical protein [Symploca sp. SIO1B1]